MGTLPTLVSQAHNDPDGLQLEVRYQTHALQEIIVACVVTVGPKGIGAAPEATLDGLDIFKLRHCFSYFPLLLAPSPPLSDWA